MASFPERRSPSHRFLPPDPRVAEPYRFTPQLALRVGDLSAFALADCAALLQKQARVTCSAVLDDAHEPPAFGELPQRVPRDCAGHGARFYVR